MELNESANTNFTSKTFLSMWRKKNPLLIWLFGRKANPAHKEVDTKPVIMGESTRENTI